MGDQNDDDSPAASPVHLKPTDTFFRSSSSSSCSDAEDDVGTTSSSSDYHRRRLDYMLMFLERKLSTTTERVAPALPEFTWGGKITAPSVRPNRPPALEVRPPPLRETQLGRSVRNIEFKNGDSPQLWGGSEFGIRVWDLGSDDDGGDDVEGSVKCVEAVGLGSEVLCVVGDEASDVVWSGHRDGIISGWKWTDNEVEEVVSWRAHRGPVLSMVISCYGDLWSGSEAGAVKIWPWEAVGKALSLPTEERHLASSLVERSNIEPRSQATQNGICSNIFTSDIKYLLSDRTRMKVWAATYQSFALWDARTRELLKVFNIDGQIENISVDSFMEDEIRMKFASSSTVKAQTSFSFFQRSRNAILGAAEAVRRAAVKGAYGDDNRRIMALAATSDGMIWVGCANGLLVQWDANGNRLQEFQYSSFAVQSLCTVGCRIWVGYLSGTMQVLNLNGHLLGEWVGHNSPVMDLTVGAGYVFSLASDGGIRGWNITSPGPLDNMLLSELSEKEFLYTSLQNLKVLVGTWNVGQERATRDSLMSWLGSAVSDIDIVVVGMQEVEMGAGFLAMSAAKETIGLEGSAAGHWWLDMIGKMIDEGSTFSRVGLRQLAGLLISVWVRNSIQAHVGDVDVAAVPCGLGRAIGNKGAVGLRIRVYGRLMCFVNCHFAAHLEAVNRRNADFDHVYKTMTFSRLLTSSAAGVSPAIQLLRSSSGVGNNTVERTPELSEADMVVFLGDLNYRLDKISYDEARDFISRRCFDWLIIEKDQLRSEMKAGNVYRGMREAIVRFPPTYKFDKHQPGLAGYDSGEKKRIPAWCDRILYRDGRSTSASTCGLDCPVVASVLQYDSCMDVTDSDHKPVRCIFSVDIAVVNEPARRQEFIETVGSNEKIKRLFAESTRVPEAIVSADNIILQKQDKYVLRITNKSKEENAVYKIICKDVSTIDENGQTFDHFSRGSFGFPRWLRVNPACGMIEPDHVTEVSIDHQDVESSEQFWYNENSTGKEAMLTVKVFGSSTTESKSHHVRVRYGSKGKNVPINRDANNTNPFESDLLHSSDIHKYNASYGVVEDLLDLNSL